MDDISAFAPVAIGTIGQPKTALDTPSLLVDLDVMEANTAKMAKTFRDNGVNWRPHTKGMKIPALAHRLIKAGAIGVTCAKLGEAEVMAAGGIGDILVANQIVGPVKIQRLVNLQRHSDVMVAVDNWDNIREIDAAAIAAGVRVRVLVEVNTGMNRAGTKPGEATVELAKKAAGLKGVKLAGLMTWEAHTLRITDAAEKKKAIEGAIATFLGTVKACRDAGVEIGIVSCGGTGTYWITATQKGITEVQAGGGIFGDVLYRKSFGVDHPYAMTVLATVTSRPEPTRIICDAGKKTMTGDAAMPEPIGLGALAGMALSAEHTIVNLAEPNDKLRVGDKLEFVVGYTDTTLNLHDELVGTRKGKVEVIWSILGRGKLK
ncbi:MAG: DSD1 family PLP-dependent enzyme [Alphaproteobacteria bacterium]|nr:DSD1 family PLP-dependent enzyme [Alphaproteobacteria bacterium]